MKKLHWTDSEFDRSYFLLKDNIEVGDLSTPTASLHRNKRVVFLMFYAVVTHCN